VSTMVKDEKHVVELSVPVDGVVLHMFMSDIGCKVAISAVLPDQNIARLIHCVLRVIQRKIGSHFPHHVQNIVESIDGQRSSANGVPRVLFSRCQLDPSPNHQQ
jgi:hypothetical protein